MPVIKSAKKKLRQDRRKTLQNKSLEDLFKKMVKSAQKNPSEENIQKAVSVVDKAAKKNIIHKNKASRIKSSLSKLLSQKPHSPKTRQLKKARQKTAKAALSK